MKALASSQYKNFGPEFLFGSTTHGWLSDLNDLNGWVEVSFDFPVSGLTIESGFHEFPDREDWGWHARPERIRLSDGVEIVLEDTDVTQTISFQAPMQTVRIDILSVYPGSKFNVVGIKRISPI